MAKVNERAEKALKRKAKEANAPYSALKAIYLKGMGAAVTSGRRPGVSPSQWAMAASARSTFAEGANGSRIAT